MSSFADLEAIVAKGIQYMSKLSQELSPEPKNEVGTPPKPAIIWQKWTQKRAQNAPTLEQIKKITEKVKISVTQTILEERQET